MKNNLATTVKESIKQTQDNHQLLEDDSRFSKFILDCIDDNTEDDFVDLEMLDLDFDYMIDQLKRAKKVLFIDFLEPKKVRIIN